MRRVTRTTEYALEFPNPQPAGFTRFHIRDRINLTCNLEAVMISARGDGVVRLRQRTSFICQEIVAAPNEIDYLVALDPVPGVEYTPEDKKGMKHLWNAKHFSPGPQTIEEINRRCLSKRYKGTKDGTMLFPGLDENPSLDELYDIAAEYLRAADDPFA
jgi:hypothetical protein